jgi:hypothetical protein
LDTELAANAAKAGESLSWSATEQAVLQTITDHVDRREGLAAAYAAADNVNVRLKLATEIRLIDHGVARLLGQVQTDLPAPRSVTSQKASRASQSRWNRERLKRGG